MKIIIKAHCKFCKKIIIEDWEKYFENCKENYLQCPYCFKFFLIEEVILKK